MVRAKFVCNSKRETLNTPNNTCDLTFMVVIEGSEENKQFFQFTPSGNINLQSVNAGASKQFEVGKSFYVDFIPASE